MSELDEIVVVYKGVYKKKTISNHGLKGGCICPKNNLKEDTKKTNP